MAQIHTFGRGDGGTGIRGREVGVEGAGSGGRGSGERGKRGRGRGDGKREERGAGIFYKFLKGVRHVLNPNAKLAYKRLFRLFCDTLESY